MRNTSRYLIAPGKTKLLPDLERALKEHERALNDYLAESASVTTKATNTYTTIWTSWDIERDSYYMFFGRVVGANSALTHRGYFMLDSTFGRSGSGAINFTMSPVFHLSDNSAAGITCNLFTVGTKIELQVKDGGVATMDWRAWVEVRRVR